MTCVSVQVVGCSVTNPPGKLPCSRMLPLFAPKFDPPTVTAPPGATTVVIVERMGSLKRAVTGPSLAAGRFWFAADAIAELPRPVASPRLAADNGIWLGAIGSSGEACGAAARAADGARLAAVAKAEYIRSARAMMCEDR